MEGTPFLVYSLGISIALDLLLAVVLTGIGAYYIIGGTLVYEAWVPALLFVADFYLRLWRRPVRDARFFDSQVEISGRGVDLKFGYDLIEELKKERSVVGDFRTSDSVSFSVKGDSNVFVIPNRKNRQMHLDLYTWLVQKTKSAS